MMTTRADADMPLPAAHAAVDLGSWENEGGGPSARTARAAELLDWAGFLARFYPQALKHDAAPLVAYVEYRRRLPERSHG